MKIAGELIYRGYKYYISLDQNKTRETWTLVSSVHKDDLAAKVLGKEEQYPVLNDLSFLTGKISSGYVLESASWTRVSGKLEIFGGKTILSEVMESHSLARAYGFPSSGIQTNDVSSEGGVITRIFTARDDSFYLDYVSKNKMYTKLDLQTDTLSLSMREGFRISTEKLEYREVKARVGKKLTLKTVNDLDYESLKEVLDLSWYEENGVVKKDYRSIKTIAEFEQFVMTPLIEELKYRRSLGQKLDLGLDTETTGLNFYDLSPDNPERDDIVAIPISWRDHQAVVVFVDMEWHANVPLDYALGRLRGFLEGERGSVNIKMRKVWLKSDIEENKPKGQPVVSEENAIIYDDEDFAFDREEIILVGHNAMFDGRVFYTYGLKTYWNDDTLQMAFNMNPRVVKGSNKLKTLSHRLFGTETPELSDILGKGNEDKYKYLRDERVAVIYGCADTDFTRLLRHEEIRCMPDGMYKKYQVADMPLLNKLYEVEYTGMPTDEEKVLRDGAVAEQDMANLREFLYKYVGSVVDMKNKIASLRKRMELGSLTEEEFKKEMKNIKLDKNARHEFELSGKDLQHVLYDVLGYRKTAFTKPTKQHPNGQPSVDKIAMERLMKEELETPAKILSSDFMSVDGKTVLLKKDVFNIKKNPVAYFLSVYKDLEKDWTSYYKPMKEQNLEGRFFKGFSMARIETRRIMSPGQTMKLKMKKNIVSLGPDWYLVDWDQMQVEPRIMTSLSGDADAIEKFRDPENDYHTETAAKIRKIPPHMLSKKDRKTFKEITLGIPYGLGPHKMCLKIYKKITERNFFQTNMDIDAWEKVNAAIHKVLLDFRNEALVEAELPDGLREFIAKTTEADPNTPYGMVKNLKGFYRLFDLTGVKGDRKKEGKIQRPAGNFPIQSMAAEIFRMILIKFHRRCVAEGIEDKIKWHMLIHDELLFSVHKSVHPMFLYKILYETCNIPFPGHTNYFVGINIGNSWAECKEDENEAPVRFVEQMVQRWDAGEFRDDDYWNATYEFDNAKGHQVTRGPQAYVLTYMRDYFKNRIAQEVFRLQPNAATQAIDLKSLLSNFTRYMVRSYVLMHYPKNTEPRSKEDDDVYESHFESWMIEYFGEGKELIGLDGKLKKVYKDYAQTIDLSILDEEDEEDAHNSFTSYWTFDKEEGEGGGDTEDIEMAALSSYIYEDDEDENAKILSRYDTSRGGATTLADLAVNAAVRYKNVSEVNGQLFLKVGRSLHIPKVQKYLLEHKVEKGLQVVFNTGVSRKRWINISPDIDKVALDEFLGGL